MGRALLCMLISMHERLPVFHLPAKHSQHVLALSSILLVFAIPWNMISSHQGRLIHDNGPLRCIRAYLCPLYDLLYMKCILILNHVVAQFAPQLEKSVGRCAQRHHAWLPPTLGMIGSGCLFSYPRSKMQEL